MGWMRDTTARWLRIMAATGDGTTPLDEGVNLIGEVAGTFGPGDKPKRFRKPKREDSVVTTAEMVTVLSRHLVTGVQASDYLLVRLAAATGQSREQILDELSAELTRWLNTEQLAILRLEVESGCLALNGAENPTYSGLGQRVEQVLSMALSEAEELVAAARAEATKIVAEAEQRPCPRCGQT
ncbi:hypothetical protein GCM10027176_66910 [Actinoallomurus bryophytorum]|uniref:Uncharacterized protein n=1 Tax=Actinoallomurus bryophytorum TaxID=1490222 RepID=A0A543BZ80_9ACTN|nr:hypothetical protein [Actinoallomurus bryophytorum]TQL90086.1 hypothetical protein FB559_7378 [Actinoallomurus bryophytorum]